MSTTVGGIRIVDMPDLGVVTDDSSVVGEHAGSGRFGVLALRDYMGGRGIVSVLDHGAKGDGVTDDTAAIQNTLNTYAGTATVLIPATGTQYIVSTINVPSHTDLIVDGFLLLRPSSTGPVLYINGASDVAIRGYGTIDGNGSNQAVVGSDAPSAVFAQNANNIRISDITIQHSLLWNLNVVASANVRVNNVTMLNCQFANEFAQGCDDCWLTGCYIDGVAQDEGFSFYGGVTNSGAIGNVITNAGADGFNVLNDGAQPAKCSNITISDNISHDNFGSGVQVNTGVGAFDAHDGIIISGNRCYRNCRFSEAGVHLYIANAYNILISNNMVSADGTYGAKSGIQIQSNVTDVTIIGNSIYNIGDATQPGVGLQINNANIVLVSSNTFHDFRSTRYMIAIGGTAGIKNVYTSNLFGNLAAGPPIVLAPQPDTIFANGIGNLWTLGNGVTNQVHMQLNGAAGQDALVQYSDGGVARWFVGKAGDAGSDFVIYAAHDDGTLSAATPFSINRGTGISVFSVAPQIATLPINAANDAAAAAAGIPVGGIYRSASALMIRVA